MRRAARAGERGAAALVARFRWSLLLSGALLTGLCVVFPRIGLLEWIAPAPSIAVLLVLGSDRSVRLRRLFGMGFAFFLAYLLVAFHWFLRMYPLDFAGLSRGASIAVVLTAWIGLSAFEAVGAACLFPLFAAAVRVPRLAARPLIRPFLFASLWTAWEWFEANSGFTGVPWGRLPLGQASLLPALQSCSLFGSYFVTFLLLTVAGLIAHLLLYAARRAACGLVAGSLFLGNLAFGACRMRCLDRREAREDARTVVVSSIQGNLSSFEKWDSSTLSDTKRIYAEESRAAAAEGAALIVWPETALPYSLDAEPDLEAYLSGLSRTCGAPILAGVLTSGEGGEYNTVAAFLPDGIGRGAEYHKRNLVPFGEFVPWRGLVMALVPPLAEIGMLDDVILPGHEATVFELPAGGRTVRVAPLVCFDSIYERNTIEGARAGADLFAVSTNDSWFKDSRGVWMHNAQSCLRAIETGRPVVRAANTGVSSVITASGRVTSSLGPFRRGRVTDTVTLSAGRTLYTVIGNAFALLCVLSNVAALIPAIVDALRRRGRRRSVPGRRS